jgi:hypothetical protein
MVRVPWTSPCRLPAAAPIQFHRISGQTFLLSKKRSDISAPTWCAFHAILDIFTVANWMMRAWMHPQKVIGVPQCLQQFARQERPSHRLKSASENSGCWSTRGEAKRKQKRPAEVGDQIGRMWRTDGQSMEWRRTKWLAASSRFVPFSRHTFPCDACTPHKVWLLLVAG